MKTCEIVLKICFHDYEINNAFSLWSRVILESFDLRGQVKPGHLQMRFRTKIMYDFLLAFPVTIFYGQSLDVGKLNLGRANAGL